MWPTSKTSPEPRGVSGAGANSPPVPIHHPATGVHDAIRRIADNETASLAEWDYDLLPIDCNSRQIFLFQRRPAYLLLEGE